ncbi:MAG: lysine--tRNA ligase [Ignavibacteriales bacterium]
MNENIEQQDLNEILKIRRQKLSELQQAGKDPFKNVKYERTNTSGQIANDFESFEGKNVSLAGRIIARRMMGKASFCNILDQDGKIQFYIKIDEVGEEKYEEYKKYDIGDIVGIKGDVFKTHTGEVSVKVKDIILLSKSLQPLPEKWHGLKDTDLRYRQRYVDLIVNTEVRDTFIKRSNILKSIRNFLDSKGFLEVETPILNVIPGGAAARPFITHHNTLDIDLYLRISPELYLKRLIVGGLEKVYEMGRVFRNEGISIKHNPEFSIMELYQAYTDYHGMMNLTEELISTVAKETLGTTTVNYQGQEVELSAPWARITMIDAVKKYTGVDFNEIKTDEEARRKGKEIKLDVKDTSTWGEILNLAFEEHVEKNLIQPTFIMDYPVEVSPLTKKKPSDLRLTERFELFITSREMANAYSELNDPIDQKERFLKQVEARDAGDEEANMMDDDFVNALEYAMPPTGGLGIGIDRLIMLLTDSYSIRDVLLFPTMKPRE